MNNLTIEATKSSPAIDFNAATGRLKIRGESFPENAAKFYVPVLDWIAEYLATEANGIKTVFEIEIVYFNSNTSKLLMTIFQMADNAAKEGKDVSIDWICDEENETAIESGEEFREEIRSARFSVRVTRPG